MSTTLWFGEFYGGRLIQWIQAVGGNARAEAFLVWNRGWERPDLDGPLRLLPRQDILSAKLRWTFRP